MSVDFRRLESENTTLLNSVEAFRQSVRTKDEVIWKMCEGQDRSEIKATDDVGSTEPVDIGALLCLALSFSTMRLRFRCARRNSGGLRDAHGSGCEAGVRRSFGGRRY